MPAVTLRQLLEAGVHFGHQTSRWNPRMRPYIFTARNGIHIIDLEQTQKQLDVACEYLRDIVGSGQKVLFVGTKKQAQDVIEEVCRNTGQAYVTHRWMGGMLTNFTVIQRRLRRLAELRVMQQKGDFERMSGKEANDAKDALQLARDIAVRNAGQLAKDRYQRNIDELNEHLRDAAKILIDITAAQRNQLDQAIAGSQLTVAESKANIVKPDEEHVIWPFNGEYWRDELGFYRQTITSKCGR